MTLHGFDDDDDDDNDDDDENVRRHLVFTARFVQMNVIPCSRSTAIAYSFRRRSAVLRTVQADRRPESWRRDRGGIAEHTREERCCVSGRI